MAVELQPITDADLLEVGEFLSVHYPPDTKGTNWGEAWGRTVNLPGSNAPNHGFLLRSEGKVVGSLSAIYSTRMINGILEHFCNLSVWCVAPEFRMHSVRMMQAILAQPGYHFTDLVPSTTVQKLNLRLGFKYLDTTTYLMPNLPWPKRSYASIVDNPAEIAGILKIHSGRDLAIYLDHAHCPHTKHLLILSGVEACYVQWRKQKHAHMKWISIRYVSRPIVLWREFRVLARWFLFHAHCPFTLAEIRVTRFRVFPSWVFPRPVKRMYKSTLPPDYIDYLYSEISSAP
jgi:hypothetical protein